MWSDTLLELERAHLLRLVTWGGTSTIVGTALYAWLSVRGTASPLLRHFALQTGLWGLVILMIAVVGLQGLTERNLAEATRLDRLAWMNTGLDVGFILVGATLACVGWLTGRRLELVGAGIGGLVQGAGLLVLELRFLAITAGTL